MNCSFYVRVVKSTQRPRGRPAIFLHTEARLPAWLPGMVVGCRAKKSVVTLDRDARISSEHQAMGTRGTTTDAACFNEPAYSDPEDVARRLTPEPEAPSQPDPNGNSSSSFLDPDMYYDMSGDRILVIFNHYVYQKWRKKTISQPSPRAGTYKDVERLYKTFTRLGFVVLPYHDLTHKEIKNCLTELCAKDHTKTSCVAVAVMTHGLGTHLCAADTLYPLTDITDTLRSAPSLTLKPKLFFIQACRERHIKPHKQYNKEINFQMERENDSLLLYSTYEDYVSYRNMYVGSWLMQSLCDVVESHHATMHLTKMITLVNKMVAEKYVVDTENNRLLKQMPVTELKLRKFLML